MCVLLLLLIELGVVGVRSSVRGCTFCEYECSYLTVPARVVQGGKKGGKNQSGCPINRKYNRNDTKTEPRKNKLHESYLIYIRLLREMTSMSDAVC